jgi:polysaccharide deacetylase family protein (PEP-CTERM system associated)
LITNYKINSIPPNKKQIAIFTVDVEDWYQSCVDNNAPISQIVIYNVHKTLECLHDLNIKGTFYVQGMVAKKFPYLINEIYSNGHEIQSHGYSHSSLYNMSKNAFLNEILLSSKYLEDAAQVKIDSFRAPDFTICKDNIWMLNLLAENGYKSDSSIFPVKTRRYGIHGWLPYPHEIIFQNEYKITELPVATLPLKFINLPIGGGGYFRLIPYKLLKLGLRYFHQADKPLILYSHPYEFNPIEDQLDHRNRPYIYSKTQVLRRKNFLINLTKISKQFKFIKVSDYLNEC